MKNKKLVYILFPLVIVVWGVIFFKIFSGINEEEFVMAGKENEKLIERDTVAEVLPLIANYRDPFLGKSKQLSVVRAGYIKKTVPNPVINPAPIIQWPQISYLGVIENKIKGSKIAIIRIENHEFLSQEREMNANVVLEKIYKDSVLVSFNKEKKIFKKE